jgi:hypothetical protein
VQWSAGWTGEVSSSIFVKLNIILDNDDLARLVLERLPDIDSTSLSVTDAWRLMEVQAELLLTIARTGRCGTDERDRIVSLTADRAKILDTIKTKYSEETVS